VDLVAATEACWEQDGSLCRWVYTRTDGNQTAANLANWFVDTPFDILLTIVLAVLATRLSRRWVKRVVGQIVAPKTTPSQQLERIGIELPSQLASQAPSLRRAARAESISVLLTSTSVVVIWTIAILIILGEIGIDLGPLLAGAGIAGVALGFGAQTLVKDCISGLFMLIEDQYGIGDVIDLGEATGVVEHLSLRTTVLRGVDGTVWHVPNGVVQRVGNLSQLWSVALVDVDVAYETDLERARDALERAASAVCEREEHADKIVEAPKVLGVEALAADGITLRVIVRVDPGAQWDIQRAIREEVKRVFDAEGIEIPFPQRTVWMRADGAPDGAA
jgi:small-conductance mechanosensitive channel